MPVKSAREPSDSRWVSARRPRSEERRPDDTDTRPGGPPILVVVLATLALPVLASSVLLIDGILQSRRSQTELEVLRESSLRYADLSHARVALARERLATGALLSIDGYGIDRNMAMAVTGLDIESEAESSRAAVDTLVDRIDTELAESPEVAGRAEAGGDLFQFYAQMIAVDSSLGDRQSGELRRLRDAAHHIDGVQELDTAVAQLQTATELHLAMSRLGDTYLALSLQLDGWDAGEEARRMQEAWFRYQSAAADLPAGYRDQIEEEPAVTDLTERFDRTISDLSDSGTESVRIPVEGDLFEALVPLTDYFREFIAAFEPHDVATQRATADLVGRLDEADADVRRQLRTSFATLAFLAGAVAFGLWAALANVITPLRRLTPEVRRLRDGNSDVRIRPCGAREIRHATVAINEAAASMAAAERRSRALASGDLSLSPEATEGLAVGASMQASLSELSAVMREREALRRQLEHAAFHDALTGLANRRGFRSQLDKAAEDVRATASGADYIAAIYIDLERFKVVNDSFGHAVGYALLVAAADRLVKVVGPTDVIGRMGGDEFLVVTFGDDAHTGERIAAAVKDRLEQPYEIAGDRCHVGASVGVATTRIDGPDDGIIHRADAASYYAKAHGSNAPVSYTDEIGWWMQQRTAEANAARPSSMRFLNAGADKGASGNHQR